MSISVIEINEIDEKPKQVAVSLRKSLADRFRSLFNEKSVEPLVFLYLTSYFIANITTENLNLEKACKVNLNFSESICQAMVERNTTGYTEREEIEVQKLVSSMLIYKTAIQGSLPFCLITFFGSWSDRRGRRKPLIILPILGDVVSTIGYIMCTFFFMQLSVEYAIFFEAVPVSIAGGSHCFFAGIFSYVVGKIEMNSKTEKIGQSSVAYSISATVGTALGAFLFRKIGYNGIYFSSLGMHIVSITYASYVLRDEPHECTNELERSFLKDFLDVGHFFKSLTLCFRTGSSVRRKKLYGVMVLGILILSATRGELSVLYMYTRRKFTWSEVDYSTYLTFLAALQILGAIFSIIVLVKFLQVDDAMLGMIGMMSRIIASITYALAPQGDYFYLGAFSEILAANSHIAMRSIISKLVPPHELGQVNSIFGMCESLTPLFGGPVYSFIYNKTIAHCPGLFFLLSTCCYTVALFIFLWMYILGNSDKDEHEDLIGPTIGMKLQNFGSVCNTVIEKNLDD